MAYYKENEIERNKYHIEALGSKNSYLKGQNMKRIKLKGFELTPACWHQLA